MILFQYKDELGEGCQTDLHLVPKLSPGDPFGICPLAR
jgi:hypothetical protein